MIEWLAGVFVQEPLHIAAVALGLAALSAVGRATVLRDMPKGNVLWVPALLWFGYAAWEWLVLVKTPEADIHAVYPQGHQNTRRVRAFVDFLAAEFAQPRS